MTTGARRRDWVRAAGVVALGVSSGWFSGCSSRPKLPDPPEVNGAARVRVRWRVGLGDGGIGYLPRMIGDRIWATSRDGRVLGIDPTSGNLTQRIDVGKRVASGIGGDRDQVVVVAEDGLLMSFAIDGKPRWSAPLGAEAASVPVLDQGMVVLRGSDSRIHAFDADSGKRRWSIQRTNPALVLRQTSTATIAGAMTYVGLPGGRLIALASDTGAVRWEGTVAQPKGSTEIERIADVVGTPLIDGRDLCAVSYQGRLTCFDAPSGRVVWSRDVGSAGGLMLGPRMVVAADEGGKVHAFSRTGASLWKQEKLARRALGVPAIAGDHVVLGDVAGLVHVLSVDDGAVQARVSTDGTPILAAPLVVDDGRLAVVQTSDAALYAIEIG